MQVRRSARVRPHQVTFVPDSEDQFTSDHGWSFPQMPRLAPLSPNATHGPAREPVHGPAPSKCAQASAGGGADRIELYTEPYAAAWGPVRPGHEQLHRAAAQAAVDVGLGVNAGHDLNLRQPGCFCARGAGFAEVSIGHAFIADALELGYAAPARACTRACNASCCS